MTSLAELEEAAAACHACELSRERQRVVFSSGPTAARLMLIGEAPGAEEDATGVPFVGRSGQLLLSLFRDCGVERDELYVTNVVKCRPPANRTPRKNEIEHCAVFLEGQLTAVSPEVVVTLGNTATRAVLRTKEPISGLRGRLHRRAGLDALIAPTFHPAAGLRGGPRVVNQIRDDLARAFAEVHSQ